MQKAAIVFLAVFLGVLFTGVATAQINPIRLPTPTRSPTPTPSPSPTPEPKVLPCPNVSVQPQGPNPLRDGQPINFILNIGGGDPKVTPTILWSTSAGYIKQGHNTRQIEVDSTGAGTTSDRQLAAEVWVGGYAPECVLQAKASVKIIAPAVKFGEFGEVPAETVTKNMAALAKFLADSQDNLFVIAYAGRNSERGYAFNWTKRIRDELVAAGVAVRRISTIDGGFREEPLFDFWIIPPGAETPRPTPTVNRNEIVYPKTPPPAVKKP